MVARKFFNVAFVADSWTIAPMPVKYGGLGLLMLLYQPTLRQLLSQKILSTTCSLHSAIFTRMPKWHTGTAPFSKSQASLLFSQSGTQHLSNRSLTLFSPTWTSIAVRAYYRLPLSITALGLTRSPRLKPEPFLTTSQSASLQHSVYGSPSVNLIDADVAHK